MVTKLRVKSVYIFICLNEAIAWTLYFAVRLKSGPINFVHYRVRVP